MRSFNAKRDALTLALMALICIFLIWLMARDMWKVTSPKPLSEPTKCAELCAPYHLESCAPEAALAICKTPDGYIVMSAEGE